MLQRETFTNRGARKGITGSSAGLGPPVQTEKLHCSEPQATSFTPRLTSPSSPSDSNYHPACWCTAPWQRERTEPPALNWEKMLFLGADGCSPAVLTALVSILFLQQPRSQHLSCSMNLCQVPRPTSHSNSWIYSSQILLTLSQWGNSKGEQALIIRLSIEK